jgi:hypothetical protein
VQSEETKKATVCLLSHFVFFFHLIVDEIDDDQHCNDEACEYVCQHRTLPQNVRTWRQTKNRATEREREKGKKRHSVFVTGNSVARTRKQQCSSLSVHRDDISVNDMVN